MPLTTSVCKNHSFGCICNIPSVKHLLKTCNAKGLCYANDGFHYANTSRAILDPNHDQYCHLSAHEEYYFFKLINSD
uniref:Uncharacterized protein n=1 Tax=Rhizophora mucronata TaxID=61149 RepID=A0A2P2KD60_RHIMU